MISKDDKAMYARADAAIAETNMQLEIYKVKESASKLNARGEHDLTEFVAFARSDNPLHQQTVAEVRQKGVDHAKWLMENCVGVVHLDSHVRHALNVASVGQYRDDISPAGNLTLAEFGIESSHTVKAQMATMGAEVQADIASSFQRARGLNSKN